MVCIELVEKVKELTSEVERLREKKQVDDNNPPIDGSRDTFGESTNCYYSW